MREEATLRRQRERRAAYANGENECLLKCLMRENVAAYKSLVQLIQCLFVSSNLEWPVI